MTDSVAAEQPRSLTTAFVLLAAIAIVLAALHIAAAIVSPFLLAMVVAFIFWPLFPWLRARDGWPPETQPRQERSKS